MNAKSLELSLWEEKLVALNKQGIWAKQGECTEVMRMWVALACFFCFVYSFTLNSFIVVSFLYMLLLFPFKLSCLTIRNADQNK